MSKEWKCCTAEAHMVEEKFPALSENRFNRHATEKRVAEYLADFLRANNILPGEVIIIGRSESSGGYVTLYLTLYTDKNKDEIKTTGGFRFNLAA